MEKRERERERERGKKLRSTSENRAIKNVNRNRLIRKNDIISRPEEFQSTRSIKAEHRQRALIFFCTFVQYARSIRVYKSYFARIVKLRGGIL